MSVHANPGQPFDPSQIGLQPPKTVESQYANLVTRLGGTPLGEGDNDIGTKTGKGTVEPSVHDVLEQIKTAEDSLPPELLGFNVGFNIQSARVIAQHQIDTLDPSDPKVPLLLKFVELIQKIQLSSGDLVAALGTQGSQILANQQNIAQGNAPGAAGVQGNTATPAASTVPFDAQANIPDGAATLLAAGSAPANVAASTHPGAAASQAGAASSLGLVGGQVGSLGGNPWFSGNSYVAFLNYYWDMLRALKEMKIVEGETQVESLNMMVDLAKETADAILDAAQTKFWEHIAMAIVDAASIVVTIACTAISVTALSKTKVEEGGDPGNTKTGKGAMSEGEVKQYNIRLQRLTTISDGISRSTQSGEKAVDNLIQAFMELKVANYEALKEILQAFRQMAQIQAERSLDMFKQNTDLIQQMIQQIDQMRSKIAEAQTKALSRS